MQQFISMAWGNYRRSTAFWLALIAAGSFLYGSDARAEIKISGDEKALSVDVQDATLGDVLSALRSSFGFQYPASDSLDRPVNGQYHGSLRRVLSNLLRDLDYVIFTTGDHVTRIVVIGPANAARADPSQPVPPRAPIRNVQDL